MKKNKWCALLIAIVLIGSFTSTSPADAAKKVTKKKTVVKKKIVQGGQNQLQGLSGKMGDWLFNGNNRFKIESISVVDAGPAGEKPSEGKKFLVAAIQLKNAMPESAWHGDGHILTFVDKDDQTIQASRLVKANNWDEMPSSMLLPAAGMKGVYFVEIDPTFVPVRCVYEVRSGDKVFRVDLTASNK